MLIAPLGNLQGAPGTIGWTSFVAQLPPDPLLVGVPIFLQVVSGDAGTASGLASSAGLRLTFFAER